MKQRSGSCATEVSSELGCSTGAVYVARCRVSVPHQRQGERSI
ncbi:MAG: hypothetical protein R3C05_27350 [Pirellulaceae bacterium]